MSQSGSTTPNSDDSENAQTAAFDTQQLAELDQYIDSALPDDSKYVEYAPTGVDALFWKMHPRLEWTLNWAKYRGTSPDGLLMCNIARMIGTIAPEFRIGDLGKGTLTLDMGVSLYGGTGAGKSTCWGTSKEMLVIEPGIIQVPELTPQGLRNYCGTVDPRTGLTHRIGYNTVVWLDEGEALNKLQQRASDSFMPTLRALTHGHSSILGSMTAGNGLIVIEDNTVRFVMVFGTQAAHVGAMFTDGKVNDGTSQRYFWTNASKSFASHPEMGSTLSPLRIENILDPSLMPPGMDSRGIFTTPGYAVQSATSSVRPSVRYSIIPPLCFEVIKRHERALKSGSVPEGKSHWGIHVAKLAHGLALYCDGVLDPTDYHVKMAIVLMSMLDKTIELIAADIAKGVNSDNRRLGRDRAVARVAEEDALAEIRELKTRNAYKRIMEDLREAGATGCSLKEFTVHPGNRKARDAALRIAEERGDISFRVEMSTSAVPKPYKRYILSEFDSGIDDVDPVIG